MRAGALDLGSGTVKLSIFEPGPDGWAALALDEVNTELRRGMGERLELQPGPVKDSLDAVARLLERAALLGLEKAPAYATSAVRRASNPQALLGPLRERFGIQAKVLSEVEEGRLNLLGARARGTAAWLVADPGGDSTELCGGADWRTAPVASLPFGSVSLRERFGSPDDNAPIAPQRLSAVRSAVPGMIAACPGSAAFAGGGRDLAIRMNAPIQRALEAVNRRERAAHGKGGWYRLKELEQLCSHLAGLDHAGRASLLEGEPVGKVDRTCYGFASWLGLLDWLGLDRFQVEPWGIKLGAALALNSADELSGGMT